MENEMKFLLILVIGFAGNCLGQSDIVCENLPRASFCLPDLKSVRECHPLGPSDVPIDTQCPSGQICGCGLFRMCDDDEPKCVPFVPVPRIPKSFVAKFSGRRNSSNPGGFRRFKISGLVFQDYGSKSLRVKTTLVDEQNGVSETRNEYILKDNSGGWTRYLLSTLTSGCFSGSLSEFPEYFHELRNFAIHRGNNIWLYRKGPLFTVAPFMVKQYKLTRERKSYFFPRSENTIDNGGPIAKRGVSTRLAYRLRSIGRVSKSYFRLPRECVE